MAANKFLARPEKTEPCIIMIGMAGSGKTTIGQALARRLDYAFMDTDHLIEAAYGTCLQNVADALTKEEFLDLEAKFITSLRVSRCVVSTGGSVVYRDAAMQHLRQLGTIVCLDAPFSVIEERIARNPDRGLAIAPGQTIEDLYNERYRLYNRYADLHCDTSLLPHECAEWIVAHLPKGAPVRN